MLPIALTAMPAPRGPRFLGWLLATAVMGPLQVPVCPQRATCLAAKLKRQLEPLLPQHFISLVLSAQSRRHGGGS